MMFSNLWLSITATILNGVLLFMSYIGNSNRFRQSRIFRAIIYVLLGINLSVMLYSLTLRLESYVDLTETVMEWTCSFLIMIMPVLFLEYLNSIFYYDVVRANRSKMLGVLIVISLAATVWLGPVVTCVNRTIILTPGRGGYLFVIPATVFLLFGLWEGVTLKASISARHVWSLRGFFVLCALAVASFMYFRLLSAYGFMASLCPLFCVYTLQGRGVVIDQETGLRSRGAFRTSVGTRMESNSQFRVILIHIRDFSALYAEGNEQDADHLLPRIGEALEQLSDMPVFRVAESSFAILQDDRDEALTQELLIALRSRFSSGIKAGHSNYRIGANVGVLDYPKDIKSMDDLQMAMELLAGGTYGARNEVRLQSLNLSAEKEIREQAGALSKALMEDRMEVWYQPILNTATGRFESAEALIRMKAEDGSYVRPDRFIPAAEQSGLIMRVGRFVLKEVCSFLADPIREELGIRYIEANLSVEECIQETLPEEIRAIMSQFGTDPDSLNIEITETSNDTATELMMTNVSRIHEEQGLSFSLDDFGTGYSNLTRILSMPVGIIKFDRSMLLKAFETENGRIVFERMAKVIHDLGREIVSEGVETEEQAAFVKSLGVEYIQGFYYAKPMGKADYINFLNEQEKAA
ncbi:MAG: EAL domain-containing protein [Solobacterium sp.]|nr:EAL domain-containing protein [Solobacterium sp.]